MKTYTFAGGAISPGFPLSENERGEKVLALGEYGRGSWFAHVPLNHNLDNRPEVVDNIVQDAFLYNARKNEKDFYILSKDTSQANGRCCLIRFLTVGESGQGDGYVNRISGFRSKELVSGHGRNNGVLTDNGTWSDSVWVVHEGELLRVQLAGCDKAFAVRVCNGEPTVEPWVERQPRQQPATEAPKVETKLVSGNGHVGRHGGNPHRAMRTLAGSHVTAEPVKIPIKEWTPGLNDMPEPKIELDAELAELVECGKRRVNDWNAKYHRQPAPAAT